MKRSLALAKRNGIYTTAIKRALTSCLCLAWILAFPALSMAERWHSAPTVSTWRLPAGAE